MSMYVILKDISPEPSDPRYEVFFAADRKDAEAVRVDEGPRATVYLEVTD